MYCRTCGTSNHEESNYCVKDGTALGTVQSKSRLQLVKRANTFCQDCGTEMNMGDNYCTNCGHSLLKYEQGSANAIQKLQSITASAGTKGKNRTKAGGLSGMTKVLIPAVYALIIMLVLNLAAYIIFNHIGKGEGSVLSVFQTGLLSEISRDMDMGSKDIEQIFGYTDQLMMSHMISPSYKIHLYSAGNLLTGSFEGFIDIDLKFAFILCLLIPMIALFMGGMIYRRRNPEVSFRAFAKGAAGIGLVYAVIMAVIALFSGPEYNIRANAIVTITLAISTAYPFFITLIQTFVLGFVFSMMGMLFSLDRRHITRHLETLMPFGHAVHQGFSVFVKGFIGVTVLSIIICLVNVFTDAVDSDFEGMSFLTDLTESFLPAVSILAVQIGAYLFGMLHFASAGFHYEGFYGGDKGSLLLSLFSGFSGKGKHAESLNLYEMNQSFSSAHIVAYALIGTLLLLGLLAYGGYKMAENRKISFKSLAVYSLVYALLASAIVHFSGFSGSAEMTMDGETSIIKGMFRTSAILVFVYSFLMAYIAAFAGKYLASRRS